MCLKFTFLCEEYPLQKKIYYSKLDLKNVHKNKNVLPIFTPIFQYKRNTSSRITLIEGNTNIADEEKQQI